MKLLYVAEGINAVFYSQVIALLNELSDKKIFTEIYLAIGQRKFTDIKINGINKNIKVISYRSYPIYPIFNLLTENSIKNELKKLAINNDFIIHTRSEFLGYLTYKAYLKLNSKKPNILIDIRGSVIEETQIYGKMNNLLKFFKLLNYKNNIKEILNNINYINTVSDELRNYVENTFNVNPNVISVIPTIAGKNFVFDDKKRKEIRNNLGIHDNDTLFIFSSGSTQSWQKDDEIVKKLTDKGYKILMLTKKNYNLPNVINKFVPYEEVSYYLNASDIGIIIRNNDIVNNVASPIKFSEYLCCGLPVIANHSVEIINSLLATNKYGKIVDLNNISDNDIKELKKLDRNIIADTGTNIFGISKITNMYIDIYNKMNNLNKGVKN